ncbi:type II toxin-antitoxin system YafQ family toxin [Candidatus Accumulibacter meliphilus]|jgi:mRNA interferase YafQ|uniref:type II toxin-antitoxin system YafQ family toxin n=1 Tax=Candidatus Accumulibacter meliphilus TaxID=2211374 RepID=UPI003DAA40B4
MQASSSVTTSAKPRGRTDKRHDHSLSGDWMDHRDCHVKPDLVLIYRKPDDNVLQLVRLGSYSELGL